MTPAATRLVRAAGGRRLPVHGGWRVPVGRARGLAHRLQAEGLLVWAQENPVARLKSSLDGHEAEWSRAAVVPPTLVPPPAGVPIGIVDTLVDRQNPDVGPQTKFLNTGSGRVDDAHGTMVASVAAGARNGTGVVGVFPGAPILAYGLKSSTFDERTCADIVEGIDALVRARVKVINLSLGFPTPCFPLEVAIALAYGRGTLVVAASGNEFREGNPISFPAAYPHVLSVAAVDFKDRPAFFSSANLAVDLAAPGVDVPVSLPLAFDVDDGVQDGVTAADGTSFSAPIVSAAAAWLIAARPGIQPGQVADLLRFSARDLYSPGWDPHTGYGRLDIAAAAAAPAPPLDPLEPNDNIPYVDGTLFARPDPPVWRGVGHASIAATVDFVEDPVDVYRVRIPARARIAISLKPRRGDANLYAYDRSAKSIDDRPIAASRRKGGRTDSLRLFNPTSRARTAYVAIDSATLAAGYRLQLRRVRQS